MSDAVAEAEGDDFLLNLRRFSPGIMMIFTTYVATISASIGDYRVAVLEQESPVKHANQLIRQAAMQTIGMFLIIMIALAILITLMTDPLDERMLYIINGISRVVASIVLAILSVRVALWLDLYPAYRRVDSFKAKQRRKLMGNTAIQLKHAVRWTVAGNILRPFCILIVLFQEGADPVTIPMSIIAGSATGLFVDFSIYMCRRFHPGTRRQKWLCIGLVAVLCFFSIVSMTIGAYFIAEVWDDSADSADNSNWPFIVAVVAVSFLPLLHFTIWRYTKYVGNRIQDAISEHGNEVSGSMTRHQRRMATSMFFSRRRLIQEQSQEDEPDEPVISKANNHTPLGAITEDHVADDDENEKDVKVMDDEAKNNESAKEMPLPLNSEDEDPEKDGPTMRELLMDWKCCGCLRGEDKPAVHKATSCAVWTGYLAFCGLCIFNVVVNMGSTHQQEWAREKLPFVFDELYRYIDEGPVCAYNGTKFGNMTSFPSREAAHDAGFAVLHCGSCAACSDWHNLELEYTTREFLALESRKCAQKSLFGGGHQDLVDCLGEPQIGFQGQCAICWADDILCTRTYCYWIALQSFMINTLANFEVGEDTITAAACEEAHCEAGNPGHFVACSGATRRRMNVTSSIKRPGSQQCSIVDVEWHELFPEPHPND